MKNLIALILVLYLLFASCTKTGEGLLGSWAVLEMFHGEHEISDNLSEGWYATPNLTFSKGKEVSIKFNRNGRTLAGSFSVVDDHQIEFKGLSDDRLNGRYLFNIQLIDGTESSRYKRYELVLESDSVFIRATRSDVKIL